MDGLQVISALTFSATIVGIISILVFGTENGGILHGKWLTKTHNCKHPSYFAGEAGDRWQCRKCKTIWEQNGRGWEAEK